MGRALLKKLYDFGCWGRRHICESNLQKGFPPHIKGKIKKTAEKLRKRGLLIRRPSHHEYQWFLNFKRKEEIEKIVREVNKK